MYFGSGIVLYFMQGFQPGAARKSERQEGKEITNKIWT